MKNTHVLAILLAIPLFLNAALARTKHSLEPHLPEIITIAEKIAQDFPPDKYNICSLGQSPSYVVKAVEYREKKQDIERCSYLAFSRKKYGMAESPESTNAYRTYLTERNFHPHQLLKTFQEHSKKMLIIDYIDTGESIIYFMNFLFKWAKEVGIDLKSFNQVFSMFFFLSEKSNTNLPPIQGHYLEIQTMRASEALLKKLYAVPNKERIVPHYSYYAFHLLDASCISLSEETVDLLARLKPEKDNDDAPTVA